jgi:hypothetical protein
MRVCVIMVAIGGAVAHDRSTNPGRLAHTFHQRFNSHSRTNILLSPDTLLGTFLRVGKLASDLWNEPNFRLDIIENLRLEVRARPRSTQKLPQSHVTVPSSKL